MYTLPVIAINWLGYRVSATVSWDGTRATCDLGETGRYTLDLPTPRGYVPDHVALVDGLVAAGWTLTPESVDITRSAP